MQGARTLSPVPSPAEVRNRADEDLLRIARGFFCHCLSTGCVCPGQFDRASNRRRHLHRRLSSGCIQPVLVGPSLRVVPHEGPVPIAKRNVTTSTALSTRASPGIPRQTLPIVQHHIMPVVESSSPHLVSRDHLPRRGRRQDSRAKHSAHHLWRFHVKHGHHLHADMRSMSSRRPEHPHSPDALPGYDAPPFARCTGPVFSPDIPSVSDSLRLQPPRAVQRSRSRRQSPPAKHRNRRTRYRRRSRPTQLPVESSPQRRRVGTPVLGWIGRRHQDAARGEGMSAGRTEAPNHFHG